MKKMLLTVPMFMMFSCIAHNQSLDKSSLYEIKSEITEVLKEGKRNARDLQRRNEETYTISMDIMDEVCANATTQEYLKDLSDTALVLLLNEQMELREAIGQVGIKEATNVAEKVYELFSVIPDRCLKKAMENGRLSNKTCDLDIINDCITLRFGTIILNNVLQEVEIQIAKARA